MPQYRRKAVVVEAVQHPNGLWFVSDQRGFLITEEQFAATYEPVSEAAGRGGRAVGQRESMNQVSKEFQIGTAILSVGHPDEAVSWLEKGIGTMPQSVHAWSNLGACYRQLSRFEESESALKKATALDPFSHQAFSNLGMLYSDLGKFDVSEPLFERAHSLSPRDTQLSLNLAMARLRSGKWDAKTWALWEYGRSPNDWAYPKIPRWTGRENIRGKRILVCREGGYGDAFLYLRWFPQVRALGAKAITFWVWESAMSLLEGHPWIDALLPAQMHKSYSGPDPRQFDYYVPLMSLPACLKATGVEPMDAYLPEPHAHSEDMEVWPPKRIGFCYKAEEHTVIRKHRSLPGESSVGIIGVVGEVISLTPEPNGPIFADWKETATVIQTLDLIISVDTAVAHLSAALGKPTWILLPMRRDQKWGLPEKSIYYHNHVRYFQQLHPLNWDSVVDEVKEALVGEQVRA